MNKLMKDCPSKGILFVIAAPSGAGKTTLVNALIQRVDNITLSISYTTRPKRRGEQEGVHYFFVDQAKFDVMVNAGEFLEHAKVFGYSYGTSKQWVETQLKANQDVILEIDWQGAAAVRHAKLNCVGIFILPPSWAVLEERLKQRGQDDANVIADRMAAASNEMSHYQEFDYVVVNDDFDKALQTLEDIIYAKRLDKPYSRDVSPKLLAELLKKE